MELSSLYVCSSGVLRCEDIGPRCHFRGYYDYMCSTWAFDYLHDYWND